MYRYQLLLVVFAVGCDTGGFAPPASDPIGPNLPVASTDSVGTELRPSPRPSPHPPAAMELLATHQARARGLILRRDTLYWIDDTDYGSELHGVAAGGGQWGVLAELEESPAAMVATQDTAFVASLESARIQTIDLQTGERAPFADLTSAPLALALSGDAVFAALADGRIVRIPTSGAPSEVIAKVDGNGIAIAVRDDEVYFATAEGALYLAGTSGFGSDKLATVTVDDGLFVDDTHLYWADAGRRAIMRMPRTGGEPETFITHLFGLTGMALDRSAVYATMVATGSIIRVGKDGTGVEADVLADALRGPASPLVVGEEIYFVSRDIDAVTVLR